MESNIELAEQAYGVLLENENDITRFHAAGFCIRLGIYVNESKQILEQYAYDHRSRLTKITDALGQQEDYVLDINGNVRTKTDRNGNVTSYSYDSMGRLLNSSVVTPGGTGNAFAAYTYAATGLKRSEQNALGTTLFAYDALGRLSNVSEPGNVAKIYGYNIGDNRTSNAKTGVAYINALFKLEREFFGLAPECRFQKRLEQSKPIADAFFDWAASLRALPKSPVGEAVHYALSQKPYLENVWLDGRTEISNNRAERSVKSFVMGRKAWLFSNTSAGAHASSVMYSILETATENGLHPYRYLEFLLFALPNSTTSNLDALLPWSESLPEYCRTPKKTEGFDSDKT